MTFSNVDQGRETDYRPTTTMKERKAAASSITLTETVAQTLDLLATKPTRISARLPPQLLTRLDRRCKIAGLNRSAFLRVMLEGTLDEMDKFDRLPRRWGDPK